MNNNDLIDQTVRELATSSTNSVTEAGPAPNQNAHLVDAINQVFALFRLNYHNQFYSAYGDTELLNQAKRLWLDALSHFSEKQILTGAKKVIETSDYLPTLNRMLQCCEEAPGMQGLPSPHAAYLEACNAPSPKASVNWSHLAVYYAGLETGWYRLAHEPETQSYPDFLTHYRNISREIAQGKQLVSPAPVAIEEKNKPPMNKAASRKQLKRLIDELSLD